MSITISQNARGDPVRDLAPSPVEPAHIYLTPSHTDDGMTTPYRYLGRESGVRDNHRQQAEQEDNQGLSSAGNKSLEFIRTGLSTLENGTTSHWMGYRGTDAGS